MLTNAIFTRPYHPSITCLLLKGSDTYISGLQDVQRQHQNERLYDPDTCITPSDPVEQTQTQLIFPCLAPRILPPIVHVVHTDSIASWRPTIYLTWRTSLHQGCAMYMGSTVVSSARAGACSLGLGRYSIPVRGVDRWSGCDSVRLKDA